jgi:hypothetical protein
MDTSEILSVKVNKTDKDVSVDIDYFVHDLERNRSDHITNIPHKDFFDALSNLDSYLAKVYYCDDEHADNYKATGFSWQGANKIVIKGKFVTDNKSIKGISSPVIDLEKESFGFESSLEMDIEEFTNEAIMLLLNQKEAVTQKTIEDAIEDNASDAPDENELSDSKEVPVSETNEFNDL